MLLLLINALAAEPLPEPLPADRTWDRALRRLRRGLDEASVREDLVRVDGHGNIELLLLSGDGVVDET